MPLKRTDATSALARLTAAEARTTLEDDRAAKPARRRRGPTAGKVQAEISAAVKVVAGELRGDVRPATLVGIWAWWHAQTYGASAVPELEGRGWLGAVSAALALVNREFDGDSSRALEYVRWCCARSGSRASWCEENGRAPRRLTWQQLFQFRQLLIDWRVAQAKRGRGRK